MQEITSICGYAWFLSGLSGCFWLLCRISSYAAGVIHDCLSEELSQLFAMVYNILLASLFSSIIALSVLRLNLPHSAFFLHQAFGFIFVYFTLKIVYTDEMTRHINDFALLGFYAGLIVYLAGGVSSRYILNPATLRCYDMTLWVVNSWPWKIMSAYALLQSALYIAKQGWDILTLQPRIKIRRVRGPYE